jgi:SAM-dependent methyltransferase
MPRIDNDKFYTSAIKRFGISAKGLNWHSKISQQKRFDAILEILPENLESYEIVDAGCGFGDFYFYMQEMSKPHRKYIGIEIHASIYSIASKQTPCEIILADVCKDNIPDADFYVCSGAMNILDGFETHLFIRKCYDASRYGFVFNILHGDVKSKTYNYLSTSQIDEIASTLKVPKVILKTGYMKDDITIGFFKD